MNKNKANYIEVLVKDGHLLIGPFDSVQGKMAVRKQLDAQPSIDMEKVGVIKGDDQKTRSGLDIATDYLVFSFDAGVPKELIKSVVRKTDRGNVFDFTCKVGDLPLKVIAKSGLSFALRQECRTAALIANTQMIADPTSNPQFVIFGSRSTGVGTTTKEVPIYLFKPETNELVSLADALEDLTSEFGSK